MDGLIDISAARALVSDEALWPRLRDFLWNFAPQIHPTWLEGLKVKKFDGAPPPPEQPNNRTTEPPSPKNHQTIKPSNLQTLLASRFVASWVLRELSVPPVFHDFPAADGSRLLLLDSPTLLSIASWLGALSSASALRHVTRGPDVAALKTALPGIYPALFAYTAYFAKTGILDTSTEIAPEAILSNGTAYLFSALAPLPPPLLHRLRLKLPAPPPPPEQPNPRTTELPPPPNAPKPQPSNGPTAKRSNGQTLKPATLQPLQLLLKLKFPEAFALCFS